MNINDLKNVADKADDSARKIENVVDSLPGVAVDKADEDRVSPALVKERTKTLNNNPRNNDAAV